jgi:hypothetical protein
VECCPKFENKNSSEKIDSRSNLAASLKKSFKSLTSKSSKKSTYVVNPVNPAPKPVYPVNDNVRVKIGNSSFFLLDQVGLFFYTILQSVLYNKKISLILSVKSVSYDTFKCRMPPFSLISVGLCKCPYRGICFHRKVFGQLKYFFGQFLPMIFGRNYTHTQKRHTWTHLTILDKFQ